MKLPYVICAITVNAILFSSATIAQNVKIVGLGASRCDKFISDTQGNDVSEKQYFAWAQGFMNGALVRAPVGVDDGLDLLPQRFPVPSQITYLRNWCDLNRNADFSDASFALFKELRTQMSK